MLIYLLPFLILFITVCVHFYNRCGKVRKYMKNVPSPKGVFILGHALKFMEPTSNFFEDTKELGGLICYRILWIPSLLISDCVHVEKILSTSKILNKSHEYNFFSRWLGSGLLTSRPEKWKKTRKIITPTFHFQILEQFVDVFNSASEVLVQKLREHINKPKINIYDYVALCALDVICETAMGTKVNAQIHSDSKYVNSVKEMSRVIRERIFSPIKVFDFLYFLSNDYRKEKKALRVLHDYTNSVIRTRRALLQKDIEENANTVKRKTRLAFLDLLLQSTLDDRPMTDQEIREEVDTFMFEGHDTTASAVSSVFYCLSLNFNVQNKVVSELHEIFGEDKFRAATYNDLQNMKYLEMVIKETLRLYPPVPFFGRKAEEDTQFGDCVLTKDVTCFVFAWGLHRNPELYPDPEKFDPERFQLEEQAKRSPFGYIPFSAGPRNCIGQRFAMLEMKAIISKVIRHYEILPVEGFQPLWVPDIIMKPMYGVDVQLRERYTIVQ